MIEIDDELEFRLGEITRKTHDADIPVMIIIEGPPASGKSRLSNALYMALDAKYTDFVATRPPRDIDLRYPFMQRFWNHLPKAGEVNIHFRSWYAQYIEYREAGVTENIAVEIKKISGDMENFEKTLDQNGYEIIKFYVNTSEEVRRKHLDELKDNPTLKWKAEEFEEHLELFDYEKEMQDFINQEQHIPWTEIDFEDKNEAINTMFKTIIDTLEERIEKERTTAVERIVSDFTKYFESDLFTFDFDKEKLSKKEYKEILPELQLKMRDIQFQLYQYKIPLILVYEGMDAAGKGGNIKRTRQQLDPTGYTINAVSAPSDIELAHHYLWRFATDIPRSGHIGFFDRSWYGRVLVERVEGLASQKEWTQAYDEIKDFEKSLCNSGAVILKFFLSLDKDEQLERFEEREENVEKQWKITKEDWRNREKWDEYLEASEDMIRETSTEYAPWHIIPGNNKKYARIEALKKIIYACEKALNDERD